MYYSVAKRFPFCHVKCGKEFMGSVKCSNVPRESIDEYKYKNSVTFIVQHNQLCHSLRNIYHIYHIKQI